MYMALSHLLGCSKTCKAAPFRHRLFQTSSMMPRHLPRPEGGRGSVRGKPLGADFGSPMLTDAPPSLRVARSPLAEPWPCAGWGVVYCHG